MESPLKVDKGKSVAMPKSSRLDEEVDETTIANVAKQFVRRRMRRTGQSTATSVDFAAEVPISLEGLYTRFKPEALAETRLKGRKEDFA